MTKLVLTFLVTLSISLASAAAEEPPANTESKHHRGLLGRLSKELGLTKQQEEKAKALYRENKLKSKEKREQLKESLTIKQKMQLHNLANNPDVKSLKSDIKDQLAKEKLNKEVHEQAGKSNWVTDKAPKEPADPKTDK